MLILHNLFSGEHRFNQLQKALNGISPKTLSLRLQELEKEGIVTKTIFAEVPLRVEYKLTEKGKSLEAVFEKMAEWGDQKI